MKIILLYLIPVLGFSQSIFTDESASGFGVDFISISDISAIALDYGYSINGKTDVYTTLTRSTASDVSNIAELGITTGSNHFILKQDNEIPLSVSLGGSFTYSWLTGNALQGISGTGTTFSLNGGLYHSLEASDYIKLIPYSIIGYSTANFTIRDGTSKLSDSSSGLNYQLGASIVFDAGSGQFAFTPALLFNEGQTGFGVEFAYINR